MYLCINITSVKLNFVSLFANCYIYLFKSLCAHSDTQYSSVLYVFVCDRSFQCPTCRDEIDPKKTTPLFTNCYIYLFKSLCAHSDTQYSSVLYVFVCDRSFQCPTCRDEIEHHYSLIVIYTCLKVCVHIQTLNTHLCCMCLYVIDHFSAPPVEMRLTQKNNTRYIIIMVQYHLLLFYPTSFCV